MQVIIDARRIAGESDDSTYIPSDPREFAHRIFHTCYMGTENSGAETRRRALQLSEAINRWVHGFSFSSCCLRANTAMWQLPYRSENGHRCHRTTQSLCLCHRCTTQIQGAWWFSCRESCAAKHPSTLDFDPPSTTYMCPRICFSG